MNPDERLSLGVHPGKCPQHETRTPDCDHCRKIDQYYVESQLPTIRSAAAVVRSPLEERELRSEKRYTVRELLASDAAMKDLLHERLLAVRDDLNFAINACNPSAAVNSLTREVRKVDSGVGDLGRRLLVIERFIQRLERRASRVASEKVRFKSVSPAVWELWNE